MDHDSFTKISGVNPLVGFIQGYNTANDIIRGRREADLQEKLMAIKVESAEQEKQARMVGGLRTMIEAFPDDWYSRISKEQKTWVDSNASGFAQDSPYNDPAFRMQQREGMQQIYASMPTEQNPEFNKEGLISGANKVFAPMLNKGTDDRGNPAARKEIVGFVPAPNSKNDGSFFMTLRVTRQDGSQYEAPITVNRTGDPGDMLRPFTIPEVFGWMRRNQGILNYIDSKAVALGDEQAAKRFSARRQGQEFQQFLGGLDQNMPTEQRQQAVFSKALDMGMTPNEAATVTQNTVHGEKYMERKKSLGGRTLQDEYTLDGGRTWTPVGQPYSMDAPSRGQDPEAKLQSQVELAEYRKALDTLSKTDLMIGKVRANMGKEIETVDPVFGNSSKKIANQGDLDYLMNVRNQANSVVNAYRKKYNLVSVDTGQTQPNSAIQVDTGSSSGGGVGGKRLALPTPGVSEPQPSKVIEDSPPPGYISTGKTSKGRPVWIHPEKPNAPAWVGAAAGAKKTAIPESDTATYVD